MLEEQNQRGRGACRKHSERGAIAGPVDHHANNHRAQYPRRGKPQRQPAEMGDPARRAGGRQMADRVLRRDTDHHEPGAAQRRRDEQHGDVRHQGRQRRPDGDGRKTKAHGPERPAAVDPPTHGERKNHRQQAVQADEQADQEFRCAGLEREQRGCDPSARQRHMGKQADDDKGEE